MSLIQKSRLRDVIHIDSRWFVYIFIHGPTYIKELRGYETETHQHFAIDALRERKPLEDLAEQLEHLRGILSLDLALETIHLVHVVRLVVTWG